MRLLSRRMFYYSTSSVAIASHSGPRAERSSNFVASRCCGAHIRVRSRGSWSAMHRSRHGNPAGSRPQAHREEECQASQRDVCLVACEGVQSYQGGIRCAHSRGSGASLLLSDSGDGGVYGKLHIIRTSVVLKGLDSARSFDA